MKLDRNIAENNGRGKYALLKLREVRIDPVKTIRPGYEDEEIQNALKTLEKYGILDWGDKAETEFFVFRLKDFFAPAGLVAYATAAAQHDPEYANEVMALAERAGSSNPFCKMPD